MSAATRTLLLLAPMLLVVALRFFSAEDAPGDTGEAQHITVPSALGGAPGAAGFARALEVRHFRFPRDHGAHPEFQHEWWYFTGNLADNEGRAFGYELTFFRIALTPTPADSPSAWRQPGIYMAHFAITDPHADRFIAEERFARGALGLAGAQAQPFRVWLTDWQVQAGDDTGFNVMLNAVGKRTTLHLTAQQGKPVVLQGDRGLSRKSSAAGNASYYYSLPRMPTSGSISIDGENFSVSGESWLDREWSTSALAADQAGWDWFALQLNDGRELVYYRLRGKDGTTDPHSAGRLIAADGSSTPLNTNAFHMREVDTWRSSASGVRYPARWTFELTSPPLELDIVPIMADQELNLTVRYWEGAVRVSGHSGKTPISGVGYVELAGYD